MMNRKTYLGVFNSQTEELKNLKENICYVCVPVAGTEGQISEL